MSVSKRDVLVIPVEAWHCRVLIREPLQLSTLEKFTLKWINRNPSIMNLLEHFKINPRILNLVMARLFYRGLIRLALNDDAFELSEKIIPFVESDTLDDYFDDTKPPRVHDCTFIQEKISGEVFYLNRVQEYSYRPNPESTNFFNVRASDPGSYAPIRNLSRLKLAKCAGESLHADLDQVDKIDYIQPDTYHNNLYLPMKQEEEGFELLVDFRIFTRAIQKKWKNAFESEENIQAGESTHLTIEANMLEELAIPELKEEAGKLISTMARDIQEYSKDLDEARFSSRLEDFKEEFQVILDLFQHFIYSANQINAKLCESPPIYWDLLETNTKDAENFVLLSTRYLEVEVAERFVALLRARSNKNVPYVLLWGLDGKPEETEKTLKQFHRELQQLGVDPTEDHFHILASNTRLSPSMVIIDGTSVLYSDYGLKSNPSQTLVTKVEGGYLPLELLEFLIDCLPARFEMKDELDTTLIHLFQGVDLTIDPSRQKFIRGIRTKFEEFFAKIHNRDFPQARKVLNDIKATVGSHVQFATGHLVLDLGNRELLIDAITNSEDACLVLADRIHSRFFDPHIAQYLREHSEVNLDSYVFQEISAPDEYTSRDVELQKVGDIHEERPNFKLHNYPRPVPCTGILMPSRGLIHTSYPVLAPPTPGEFSSYAKHVSIVINSKKHAGEIREKILDLISGSD